MTYLTGGVTTVGTPSGGSVLGGLVSGAGQVAGMTLQGLANLYGAASVPTYTTPVLTGSAQSNVLPNTGASVIYNTPTQNNTSTRFNNIQVSQPKDPFATEGLSSNPNMLTGGAQFMSMDNATRSNAPMQTIDNLTGSATDQGIPQGVGQLQPGVGLTPTGSPQGNVPAGQAQGAAPMSKDDELAALRQQVADYQRREADNNRAKDAALELAQRNYNAPDNMQPGQAPQPVQSPPSFAPNLGPPSVAQAASNQAPGIANKFFGGVRQLARNYQYSKHPQYAQMEMQSRSIQNAREMAWWKAKADAEKESRDHQHDFSMLQAKQSGEHQNKIAEMDHQGEIDIKKARIAQELTEQQRLQAYGAFYHSTPNSPERQQLALRLPELANHLNDPQDMLAASQLNKAGAEATKATIDSLVAQSTMQSTVELVLQKVKEGKISLEEAQRTLQGKVDQINNQSALTGSKARVAKATEGAQINQAQQEAWGAGVRNAYLPRTLESTLQSNAASTAANVGNALLGMPAPGKNDPSGQAMRKQIANGVEGLVRQAVGIPNGVVPAPPGGPSAMPQYAVAPPMMPMAQAPNAPGIPAPMGAPTGMPYGYQQASFDPRSQQQPLQAQIPQMDRTGMPLQGSVNAQAPIAPQPPIYQAQPIPIPAFPNIPNNQPMPAPPAPTLQAPMPMPQAPQPAQFGQFPAPQPVSFNAAAQNIIDQLPPALKPLGVALAGTMAGIGDGLTNGPLAQQAQRVRQAQEDLRARLPLATPAVIQNRNELPQLPPQQDFPNGPFGQAPQGLPPQQDFSNGPFGQAPQALPPQQDLPGGPFSPKSEEAPKSKSPYKIGISNGYADVKNFPGLVQPGNLPLNERRILDMENGSFGTELSLSFNDGKNEVLIPTIYDGAEHTPEQAIRHYRQTGLHMGKFRSGDISSINRYADKLHNRRIEVDGQPYDGMGAKGILNQQADDGTWHDFMVALDLMPGKGKKTGTVPQMGADGVFRGDLGTATSDGNFRIQRYTNEAGEPMYGYFINGVPVREKGGKAFGIRAEDWESYQMEERSKAARRLAKPQPRRR